MNAIVETTQAAVAAVEPPQRQLTVVEYAMQSGATPAEIKALVELQIQMDNHRLAMQVHQDARDKEARIEAARLAYDEAHAAFKAESVVILKTKFVDFANSKGGRTQYMHAELSGVIEVLAPALSKHGFSWDWKTNQSKDWIDVTCTLKHKDGHSESVTLGGSPDGSGGKNSIQAVSSTITYLQRTTLKAIAGVAEKGQDDDGAGGEPIADPLEVWAGRAALAQTLDDLGRVSKDGAKHFRGVGDVAAYKEFAAAVTARGAVLRGASHA